MKFSEFFEQVYPKPKGPSAYIQWKETDACLGFDCKCGAHSMTCSFTSGDAQHVTHSMLWIAM
jgi:hypothetical protein